MWLIKLSSFYLGAEPVFPARRTILDVLQVEQLDGAE
jgi:hypothetical protein